MKSQVLVLVILALSKSTFSENEQDRDGRILTYRQNGSGDGLNFEHIISLWNKSAEISEEPPISQRWSMPNDRQGDGRPSQYVSRPTTPKPTTQPPPVYKKPDIPENFGERFKFCVNQQQKRGAETSPGQNVIVKCFKTELISKLQRVLSQSDASIKLFNGYLEFEKINAISDVLAGSYSNLPPRKRYSSRVAAKKSDFGSPKPEIMVPVPLKQSKTSQNHGSSYYENYQKMLKELVSRKSGSEKYQRLKRDVDEEEKNTETLQKTATLFENGRKLFSEITNRLENEEEDVENLTETILDPELLSTLNAFSRRYAVRLNFYPGISARMKRNQSSGVTFDLELDELSDDDDDDDDEEEDEDSARGDKKKKKKKKIKISKKTLKKLFPYLLIPFMIQAALLPFVLKFLLFVAIKALIAGKLALVLVAFNVLKNASHKSDEDEYAERMAVEHYGYGGGEEYGAWVNRRNLVVPQESFGRKIENNPYRAHAPERTGRDKEE